jgi:UDP-glucose 4-epimerase
MKRVLITGHKGYIGQHLCKMLKGKYKITGVDFKDESKSNIFDLRFPGEEEYDTVIHLAAFVNVGSSVDWPYTYYHNNIEGTHQVLTNVRYKNFIFASTGAAENPVSPYGISKRAAEDVVANHCKRFVKDYTTFRFYNVVGSDGFPPTNMDGLMHNLIKAEKTGQFNLYGYDYDTPDGTALRDYVHVNEICTAIHKAISKPSNVLENLGHGEGTSVLDMVETFKKVNSIDFKINLCDRRPGDLPVSVLKNVSPYMEKQYTIEELLEIT